MTFVLGLTGSIGMGKSTTAEFFRQAGVPVHDSDATVHALYAGRAAALVEAAFPGVVIDGVVDRKKLGERVLGNPEAMRKLEAIVHPLVREEEEAFLEAARRDGAPLVVLDIPLLFETGAEPRCHGIVVVSAPSEVQRARVLARPGMTEEQFELIHVKQMPDAEKRRRADFIVDSSRGLDEAEAQVRDIIRTITSDPPSQWQRSDNV
ncbi:dephospho-CoA kinase [Pseudochelatococcus contaminans]|uniref:Dephospho-CoA kinase n=1 Tax=Pseudochelatococcus contaminans TaxID=1538103 RepID=A0A7W5Z6G1_9HYPH|nr:dephospho-CoA kinase [Pseudochelatococcus contaminans]MBB3811045.1 dephospho-CoA kinase [Pseudochelatococcus contaminans]